MTKKGPVDPVEFESLVNYISGLRLDLPDGVCFDLPLEPEEIEAVAEGLYSQEGHIRFIKRAVEARDPIDSVESTPDGNDFIRSLRTRFSLR